MAKIEECQLQTPILENGIKSLYLINDVEVKKEDFLIPVENLAVWRGDGVFEALKIHDHYPFGIEKHIDRLQRSCKKQ